MWPFRGRSGKREDQGGSPGAQREVVEGPHPGAQEHPGSEARCRGEKQGTRSMAVVLGVGHVIGAVQAATQVAGPIRESTDRPFSAWNWRATRAVCGP
ncbi:hypothetical protein GCM10009603_05060 [Nocardiopsis exhalans]